MLSERAFVLLWIATLLNSAGIIVLAFNARSVSNALIKLANLLESKKWL